MKKILLNLTVLAALGALPARADFNPVALTPGSFTADVIVEKTAPKSINDYTTATMDNVGTNNTANVWYETGYFANAPWTGVPAAGSTFVSFSDPNRQFRMPANYAANNALFIATHSGLTTGTLTLTAPAAFSRLSVMGSSGNGPVNLNYTVHHSGGPDETGSIAINDWFGGSTYAWCANGRISVDGATIGSLSYTNGNGVRINYADIVLNDTVNPVTSIDFTYTSGGRTAIFGVSGSTDGTVFTPVTVTGFNRDMVVEATAPKAGYSTGANVTMENPASGAANAGNGWYEQGFNRGALTTGLPTNGTSFTTGTRTYQMAPDYTTNCVFFISENPGLSAATITLSSPASFTSLSFLSSAGNGAVPVNVTVHHASDPDEVFSISVLDWFNAATATFTANGRYVKESRTFNNVNGGVKIFNNDITLVGTSPVTSIDLSYGGGAGGGRAMIFAVSGSTGGNHTPITVSGYNADGIVERTQPANPLPLANATTVSMDGGTNNTANTWYERGYYNYYTNTGFPPAGSTIDSLAQPDHHYLMPANYAANNAVYIDAATTSANLTIASPATYSALSFLSATANGTVTNQAIMQYADGTSETNTFNSVDWFGNTPYAFVANGRVNLNNRTINSDPGRNATPYNPRLYEAQFALGNVSSPVTNILLRYLNPTNSTGRLVVFAVSATAGAVPPIIASVSVTPTATYDGSNVVFNAVITGGTAPITYQWQKGTNGVYVNVSNGGTISGATTTNMVITGAVPNDAADYRLVASNVIGPVNSGIVTLNRVLSPVPDVTSPSDLVTLLSGTTPGAEGVAHVIDNDTSKYLNFDDDAAAPFVGPVGFVVKPAIGNTIVTALRIYTANDADIRDPANYVLEGSIDGYSFTPISSASLALPGGRNASPAAIAPLTHSLQEVRFANTAGYNYYRLTFNNVKNDASAAGMQIGEVEFLGVLNPNPPPSFTIAPTDVAANEGTTATFTSLATGPAPLTYQWYDVTGGDPGTLLPGQTGPNLSLNNVTTSQNGNRYRVVATNPYGSVTNPSPVLPGALLTINSGAISIVQDLPAEVLFYAGRTVSLAVGVAGTAPSYRWQSNGVNLVNGGRISGATSNVLTIANLQLTDAATYQLQSTNDFGGPVPSVAASVYVTVAPTFHDNGVGWAFTNQGGGGSFFSAPNVLTLTTAANDQRRAAWFTTPMNISGFQASFLYRDVTIGGADGFAFVLQNSAQGTNAIGGGGGGMAYDGITPSAAVKFNIYGSSSLAFTTGGASGSFVSTSPVDLSGGDPIQVNLNYDGSTLRISLSNTVSAATFTTNVTAVNLPGVVGANVAYVGITAATGGLNAEQQVSDFRYIPVPSVSSTSVGGNVLLTWPGTIGGYRVDVTPSLAPASWSSLSGLIDQTNATMYKVIAPSGSNNFYRLALPLP